MRKFTICLLCLLPLCGCEKPGSLPADVVTVLQTLRTDPSAREIRKSEEVLLERARTIGSQDLRRKMIVEWKKALLSAPVEKLPLRDRCWSIRAICETLNWGVTGAMTEAGCAYDESWDVVVEALKWLDENLDERDPRKSKPCGTWREESERWNGYLFLSEFRENLIENIERSWFDVRRHAGDDSKIAETKAQFEILIGRRVRSPDEIKTLGFYTKQVVGRILAERDAALNRSSHVGESNGSGVQISR